MPLLPVGQDLFTIAASTASIAGLLISIWTLRVAKSTRAAVQEAREQVASRIERSKLVDDADQHRRRIKTALDQNRLEVVISQINELVPTLRRLAQLLAEPDGGSVERIADRFADLPNAYDLPLIRGAIDQPLSDLQQTLKSIKLTENAMTMRAVP